MQFAVLAEPNEDQRARMTALANAQVTVVDDGTVAIWSSAPQGIIAQDDLILCGIARISNRDEFLSQGAAASAAQSTDLEMILSVLLMRGVDALEDLQGQFSLVLWDKADQRLTAIRDRFGVLPCFWTAEPVVGLSSDLRLLSHLSARPLQPDMQSLADYLAGVEDTEIRTAFEGLGRLPKAHRATWVPGAELQRQRYWSLPLPNVMSADRSISAVTHALKSAVDRSIAADDQTGCMLSGGLDSSTLAVLAAQAQPSTTLKTLSFVYRDTDSYNERQFIDDVNASISAEPILIPIDGPPSVDALPALVEEQFELCTAPGLMKSRRIYAAAQERGVTRLLDGHGGDEVISHGYGWQAELAANGQYGRLLREMRGAARIYGTPYFENYLAFLFNYAPLAKRSVLRRAIGFVGRRISRGKAYDVPAVQFLDDAFRKTHGVDDRIAKAQEETANHPPSEQRDHFRNVTSPVMTRAFEVLRRSAQAHDVEPLYPFFEQALVETCLAVPSEQKLRGGWSRWILREAMGGILPRTIQWRPDKADFSAEVLHFVLDYLSDPYRKQNVVERLEGMIDPDRFEAAHQALAAKEDDSATGITLTMWRCLYVAEWFGQVADWNARQTAGTLWQVH